MEFTFVGRNVTISDRFREYVNEKAQKVEKLADKPQNVDVKVTQQAHAKNADSSMTVELTVVGRGPIIRSEAKAGDKFAAFDVAFGKLQERLRRAHDRRKVHYGRHTPSAVHQATATITPVSTAPITDQFGAVSEAEAENTAVGSAPVLIRRKVFPAQPMTLDDAVDAMELVGHQFYVFRDAETGQNSVVYRRAGMTYGVISLDDAQCPDGKATENVREYRAS